MTTRLGRYALFEAIASGGMATVHLGRLRGPAGFSRTVAIKRLRAQLGDASDLGPALLDEGRVTARIQNPFVVQTLDVVASDGELAIVMEYVHGVSLARLMRAAKERGELVDPCVAVTILTQVLHGLHAAHEVTGEDGASLGVVHRDVSPQNILVSVDGVARVLDFGIAKVMGRAQTTREGELKGKLAYMAPEQILAEPVDRRTDVFGAAVVLWEVLTGQRLFARDDPKATLGAVLHGEAPAPSQLAPDVDGGLDAIVLRGLARRPDDRFATAAEMARALEAWGPVAPASEIGAWVDHLAHDELAERRARILEIERTGEDAGASRATNEEATKSAYELSGVAAAGSDADTRRASVVRARPLTAATAALVAAALAAGGAYFAFGRAAPASGGPNGSLVLVPAAPAVSESSASESASIAVGTARAAPPVSEVDAGPKPAPEPSIAPKRATPMHRAAPAKSSAPDCTNPYVLDAQGRQRYRRECLAP